MAVEAILTPFPIDASIGILGHFRPSSAKDDADLFLLNQAAGYAPLFVNPSAAFDRPPMIRTWPWTSESDNHVEWHKWSYQLEETYGQ